MSENFVNQIYYGDNLDVMNDKIADNSIDLIYLDPPFNSNRNYNRIYSTNTGMPVPEEAIAFCDAWELMEDKIEQIKLFTEELRVQDNNENFANFWEAWVKNLQFHNFGIYGETIKNNETQTKRCRLIIFALRPNGKPLCKNNFGWNIW